MFYYGSSVPGFHSIQSMLSLLFAEWAVLDLRIFAYQPLSIATGPRQKPVSKQALATCIRSNQSQKWQNNHHQGFDLLLRYSWNWE